MNYSMAYCGYIKQLDSGARLTTVILLLARVDISQDFTQTPLCMRNSHVIPVLKV